MKAIIISVLLLSSCSLLKKKPVLPSDQKYRLQCIESFLEDTSVDEAINICRFVNKEK